MIYEDFYCFEMNFHNIFFFVYWKFHEVEVDHSQYKICVSFIIFEMLCALRVELSNKRLTITVKMNFIQLAKFL